MKEDKPEFPPQFFHLTPSLSNKNQGGGYWMIEVDHFPQNFITGQYSMKMNDWQIHCWKWNPVQQQILQNFRETFFECSQFHHWEQWRKWILLPIYRLHFATVEMLATHQKLSTNTTFQCEYPQQDIENKQVSLKDRKKDTYQFHCTKHVNDLNNISLKFKWLDRRERILQSIQTCKNTPIRFNREIFHKHITNFLLFQRWKSINKIWNPGR